MRAAPEPPAPQAEQAPARSSGAERLYAVIVALYPRAFRRAFGVAATRTFGDRYRALRGARAHRRLLFLVRELGDLLGSVARERTAALARAIHSPRRDQEPMLTATFNDARHALRALLAHPASTITAIAVMALGLGASTAVYSVLDAVLLRPMPYDDPDRLVIGWHSQPGQGLWNPSMSKPEWTEYRENTTTFASISAWGYGATNIIAGGTPIPMWTTYVASDLLETLGVEAMVGRSFRPEEHQPGNERVVMINGRVWQGRFGADPAIVGTTVDLEGVPHEVVGILPMDFQIPVDVKWPGRTGLVLPLLDPQPGDERDDRLAYFIGRLAPGVTVTQAETDLAAVGESMQRRHPDLYSQDEPWAMRLVELDDEVVGSVRPALLLLGAAVALVLLIACANVASLTMARAARRERELALHQALGAGRARLLRRVLIEAILVALAAGGIGLLLTVWGIGSLITLVPGNLPRLDEVAVDGRIFGFALAASLLTGVGFGLIPAVRASGTDVMAALRESRRGGGPGRHRAGDLIVGGEAAVALIVVVAAGLVLRSFAGMVAIDPGFRVGDTLVARYALDASRVEDPLAVVPAMQRMADTLAALPGVESVGMVSNTPLWTTGPTVRAQTQEQSEADDMQAVWLLAGPDYFGTMGVPVLEGREFHADDTESSALVAIVNRRAADLLFPDGGALGRQVRFARRLAGNQSDLDPELVAEPPPWLTLVGVVGDTLHAGIDEEPQAEIYVAYAQGMLAGYGTVRYGSTMLRASGDVAELAPLVRDAVRAEYPDLPVSAYPMRRHIDEALAEPLFALQLMGAFALAAFLLAGIGIYGVISYAVAEGRRELGIRLAVGARRTDVVRGVVRRWMTNVTVGLAAGIGISALGSAYVQSVLYEVSPTDALTYGAATALLLMLAAAACYLPARRAAQVDPLLVIRDE